MKLRNSTRGRGHWPLPRLFALGALATVGLAGCDTESLLNVDDPEFATPISLSNPAAIPTLIAGAIGDFQAGYSGAGGDALLTSVAVFTDEHYASGTFTTRIAMDQRDLFPTASGNTSDAAFRGLQRARRSLSATADAIAAVTNASDARIARLRALEGFTYVGLGENFCSSVPISNVVNGQREEGEALSTTQLFEAAIDRYNTALAINANDNLAKVGRGRALLNLGRHQEAAAAVAGVPRTFVHFIEHSVNSSRQENPIFTLQANGRYSLSNNEGGSGPPFGTPTTDGEGLSFREARDPRAPWRGPVPGFDANVPMFTNLRYPDFGADVPLATGVEAQLILAEAALRNNQPAQFLEILNSLRAQVQPLMGVMFPDAVYPAGFPRTLAPLTDPGTQDARVDLLFRERGFWLLTTAHRLGDLRRLVRQYGRQQQNVFPSGPYFKGGVYGNDVAFPVPFDEANNSRFDPASCNTTQA
jgi:tetratricopeptide (TPR) repeat protein